MLWYYYVGIGEVGFFLPRLAMMLEHYRSVVGSSEELVMVRHIVPLSGKDSAATAFLLHKLYPEMTFEYVMTPVRDREPAELIPWLQVVAQKCGGDLQLVTKTTFQEELDAAGGFLPSPRARWCTRLLKIVPFERHVAGEEPCTIYLGLRADEDRDGNTGEKKGLFYEYPLVEHDVDQMGALLLIAEMFGVPVPDTISEGDLWRSLIKEGALPSFYSWMSHANCYGCIFWRVDQWRELYYRKPEMYWEFAAQEDVGSHFTYKPGWSLAQLAQRFDLERNGMSVGPRRGGLSQLRVNLDILQCDLPEEDPWEKPCAACRIGG